MRTSKFFWKKEIRKKKTTTGGFTGFRICYDGIESSLWYYGKFLFSSLTYATKEQRESLIRLRNRLYRLRANALGHEGCKVVVQRIYRSIAWDQPDHASDMSIRTHDQDGPALRIQP